MNEELTAETIKKLLEIPGEVKGAVFKTDATFVIKEKGAEGLKQLEEELKRVGCPIKYEEAKSVSFHPVGLRAISLLAMKKVFGFNNDKIKEIGRFATRVSLIVRLFVRYFSSTEKFLNERAPKLWSSHWTKGILDMTDVNMKEKYAVARIRDFNLCPTFCYYLSGYFEGILSLTTGSDDVHSEEVKCTFRGDNYHEYLTRWK